MNILLEHSLIVSLYFIFIQYAFDFPSVLVHHGREALNHDKRNIDAENCNPNQQPIVIKIMMMMMIIIVLMRWDIALDSES